MSVLATTAMWEYTDGDASTALKRQSKEVQFIIMILECHNAPENTSLH
jgi:hypothetical protein